MFFCSSVIKEFQRNMEGEVCLEKVGTNNKRRGEKNRSIKWKNRRSRGELQIFTVKFSEWVKVPPAAGDAF